MKKNNNVALTLFWDDSDASDELKLPRIIIVDSYQFSSNHRCAFDYRLSPPLTLSLMARGVTCRECGCLNFSSKHEVCDRCRSKTLTLHPTAQRLDSSSKDYAWEASNIKSSKTQARSLGKKRRYDKTKNNSNKKRDVKQKLEHKNVANVIDLISDDDEADVAVQQVVLNNDMRHEQQEDNIKTDDGHEEDVKSLFQSRVFPSVTFMDSHFPSVDAVATMRKQAAKRKFAVSQRTAEAVIANVTSTSDQVPASQPTSIVLQPAQEKAAEPTPIAIAQKNQAKKLSTTTLEKTAKGENADAATTNGVNKLDAAAGAQTEEKETLHDEQKLENSLFQSRVFDSIEFQASDFVTVFDGLAVARRSRPPTSKTAVFNGAPLTSVESTVATESGIHDATDVEEPAKATTVTSSATASAAPRTTTNTTFVARPSVSLLSESAASKVPAPTHAKVIPATSAIATPAKSSPAAPSASVPHPQSKMHVASVALSPALAKPTPLAVKAPAKVPAVPPTKVPTLPSLASSASSSKVQSIGPATSSSPTPAAVKQKPAASAFSTTKTTPTTATTANLATITPQFTPIANSAATKASCASTAHSDRDRVNDSANVLLPKKKHLEEVRRSGEEQRHQKPSPSGTNASFDADGILFVKVNAVPREMTPVEPPVLGYCSPEFLEFMRECGDYDGDEEDDPDDVSRSQLKLLDVVDLTSLSDLEDSNAGSPLSVGGPKGEAQQRTLPASEQAGKVGQSTAYTTENVSGKGTWYVPTLDSERKRTHLEKVMCELCEEKGIPFRLVRCPTCTKYFHKKCARENGDENICWNCELGSMIDDSELDEEHAKHNSEYLAYLKAMRGSPEDGEDVEDEIAAENEDQEGDQVAAEENVEHASSVDGGEDNHPFSEESNAKSAGKSWKEFIGDATADIDASYVEVTKRIAEELRDDEKRCLYSRGFVSREEFEAQMTEVEEYYIKEEARLQQLEREKALEAKKVAEARKAQAEAEQILVAEQPAGNSVIANNTAAMLKPVIDDAANVLTDQALPSTPITAIAPPMIASTNPETVTTAPMAASAAPMAAPTEMHSTPLHPTEPTAAHIPDPVPSVPIATIATAFSATFDTPAVGSPLSLRSPHNLSLD